MISSLKMIEYEQELTNYVHHVLTWEDAHYNPVITWDHYALPLQLNNYILPVLTWEAANNYVLPSIKMEYKEMKLWDINEY